MKYITPGTVTAVLGVGALLAAAFGKSTLAAYLTNPETAQTVLAVAGGLATVIAGALPGIQGK